MKRFLVSLIVCFIPVKKWRHQARACLLGQKIGLPPPLDTPEAASEKEWKAIQAKYNMAQDMVQAQANPDYARYREYEFMFYPEILKWVHNDIQSLNSSVRMLDVGGGYGTMAVFASAIMGADVSVIDFVDSKKSMLFENNDIKWEVCNIETMNIPFKEKFDIITMTEVLEHFNFNPVPTLKKLHDALKKNGVLYLTTPNAKFWGRSGERKGGTCGLIKYYDKLSDMPEVNADTPIRDDHIWQYNVTELLYVLESAGFVIVDFDYGWFLPGIISRRHFQVKCMRKEDVLI